MTKNDNSDSSEDIKVGDKVITNHDDIGIVVAKGKGFFFYRYIIQEKSKCEDNYFYYYKKYRWQLFKIS